MLYSGYYNSINTINTGYRYFTR